MSKSILVIPRDVITNLSSFEDETSDRYYEIPAHLLDEYTQDTTELLIPLDKCEKVTKYGLENSCSVVIDNIYHRITEETYEILDKLNKALGGLNE